MQLYIPVAGGLEAVVKRQLNSLGYTQNPCENGRIALKGDWADIARLNLRLRSGERVLLGLAQFKATTFDELFDGVFAIDWRAYIAPKTKIMMDGKSLLSQLGAIKSTGAVVKKAIIKKLVQQYYYASPNWEETGESVTVGVSLYKDVATITLDTSGDGLHKRGYRDLAYTAPLKETTASALIDMTYYFPDKAFADVFCGSGTLPIEAALKARNMAVGINRHFAFESWRCTPKDVLPLAKEQAKDEVRRDVKLDIYASDINPEAISIAKHHAKRAGVEKDIHFAVADASTFKRSDRFGVWVSNPPYGERLSNEDEIKVLYRTMGQVFKNLPDWNSYFLTGFADFERYFGKRADKVKKLSNANIECGYYSYLSKKPTK